MTAQCISGVLCLCFIIKKYPVLQPSGAQWRLERRYAMRLCGMGIPMGLQYSITAIGSVVLQAAVNTLGTMSVAAVAAAEKLVVIFCCPFDALGSAIATYAGQNVGAGKPGGCVRAQNAVCCWDRAMPCWPCSCSICLEAVWLRCLPIRPMGI